MCFDWVLNCPQSLALRPLFSSTPSTKCLFNGKIICTLRHRRVSEIVIFISSNCWVNRPGSSDEWRTQYDYFRLRNYFSICNGRHSVRVCCHSSNGLNEQMSDFHVKINTCARNFDPSGACCMFTDYNQHLRFHSSFFCFSVLRLAKSKFHSFCCRFEKCVAKGYSEKLHKMQSIETGAQANEWATKRNPKILVRKLADFRDLR